MEEILLRVAEILGASLMGWVLGKNREIKWTQEQNFSELYLRFAEQVENKYSQIIERLQTQIEQQEKEIEQLKQKINQLENKK